MVVAIGWDAARAAEQGILKLAREWGLQLSQKPETTRPFSHNVSTLGAAYDLSNPRRPRCVPTAKTVTNLATTMSKLEIMPGRQVRRLEVEKLAGYLCIVARCIAGGTLWCNSIISALKVHPHNALDSAIVSHQDIEDSLTILAWLGKAEPAPLIRNVVYHFVGDSMLACDASASRTVGGWGTFELGQLAYGAWPATILRLLSQEVINISELELLVFGFLLVSYVQTKELRRQIVIQCDSANTVGAVNSNRTKSAPTLAALRIYRKIEGDTRLKRFAVNIPGRRNIVPD